MRRNLLVLPLLFLCPVALAADEKSPSVSFKDPAANAAVKTAVAAEAKAKAEYDKALTAIRTKLIEQLTPMMEKATRTGDLDEAVKLRDKINALKAELEALKPPSPLAGDWQVTCLTWHDTMRLAADGTCSFSSSPDQGHWSVERGRLVVKWETPTPHVDTYSAGSDKQMTGTKEDGKVLTAIKLEPKPPAP